VTTDKILSEAEVQNIAYGVNRNDLPISDFGAVLVSHRAQATEIVNLRAAQEWCSRCGCGGHGYAHLATCQTTHEQPRRAAEDRRVSTTLAAMVRSITSLDRRKGQRRKLSGW